MVILITGFYLAALVSSLPPLVNVSFEILLSAVRISICRGVLA